MTTDNTIANPFYMPTNSGVVRVGNGTALTIEMLDTIARDTENLIARNRNSYNIIVGTPPQIDSMTDFDAIIDESVHIDDDGSLLSIDDEDTEQEDTTEQDTQEPSALDPSSMGSICAYLKRTKLYSTDFDTYRKLSAGERLAFLSKQKKLAFITDKDKLSKQILAFERFVMTRELHGELDEMIPRLRMSYLVAHAHTKSTDLFEFIEQDGHADEDGRIDVSQLSGASVWDEADLFVSEADIAKAERKRADLAIEYAEKLEQIRNGADITLNKGDIELAYNHVKDNCGKSVSLAPSTYSVVNVDKSSEISKIDEQIDSVNYEIHSKMNDFETLMQRHNETMAQRYNKLSDLTKKHKRLVENNVPTQFGHVLAVEQVGHIFRDKIEAFIAKDKRAKFVGAYGLMMNPRSSVGDNKIMFPLFADGAPDTMASFFTLTGDNLGFYNRTGISSGKGTNAVPASVGTINEAFDFVSKISKRPEIESQVDFWFVIRREIVVQNDPSISSETINTGIVDTVVTFHTSLEKLFSYVGDKPCEPRAYYEAILQGIQNGTNDDAPHINHYPYYRRARRFSPYLTSSGDGHSNGNVSSLDMYVSSIHSAIESINEGGSLKDNATWIRQHIRDSINRFGSNGIFHLGGYWCDEAVRIYDKFIPVLNRAITDGVTYHKCESASMRHACGSSRFIAAGLCRGINADVISNALSELDLDKALSLEYATMERFNYSSNPYIDIRFIKSSRTTVDKKQVAVKKAFIALEKAVDSAINTIDLKLQQQGLQQGDNL